METAAQKVEADVAEPQVSRKLPPVSRPVSWLNRLIPLPSWRKVTSALHGQEQADAPPAREECLAQVGRLVASSPLAGSESLSRLLLYLSHHTLNSPVDHLKEYRIATEVLGRPADFDPQSDSSVRVQVGRLRHKLDEYYQSEGARDAVLVDIPKGRYALAFSRRITTPEVSAGSEAPAPTHNAPSCSAARLIGRPVLLAAAMLASAAVGAIVVHEIDARGAKTGGAKTMPPALNTFWTPFFQGQDDPYVVYSNAAFVGSPSTAMHYYDPARDAPAGVVEHYTGVGELMGAVELDRLSALLGRQFRFKRGGLFTLDDALNNNLIFLGSPTENAPLAKMPNAREFVFGHIYSGGKSWWGVVNEHPRPGELPSYPSTPPVSPMKQDLAVMILTQGLNPDRRMLILEGISTLGTQAAVDFVCDEVSMNHLLRALNMKPGGPVPLFEALLEVKVAGDVALEARLVAVHKTTAKLAAE